MALPETSFAVQLLGEAKGILAKRLAKIPLEEWEKFKVDFDLAFTAYTKNACQKYSRIKTILYRTEPKYIYDFFEIPSLKKERGQPFLAVDIGDVTRLSHFLLLRGSGGIGKSTLMKHFYLSALESRRYIPIFLELREINDIGEAYQLEDLLYKKLAALGSTMKRSCLEYAFQSGSFLFLLDGYDEIHTDRQERFIKCLESFCDRFPDNYYILSSRPCSEFVEFQRFLVLSTLPLSMEQAVSLIRKIDFDAEIKEHFLEALQQRLYRKHRSFASNPLLLNIMLLTFDNYAEIPEKLHLFYSNAFETLYSKHDATKAGYRREMQSRISYDDFRKVFSYFCFLSYCQGKYEFSHDDLVDTLQSVRELTRVPFDTEKYTYDLESSVCMINRDGLYYQFAHRSFQEYFSAVFLKELSDEKMGQLSQQVIKRDIPRATNDSVFKMLFDMAPQRFENNILVPLINEVEESVTGELYDHYFAKAVYSCGFTHFGSKESLTLGLATSSNWLESFLFQFTFWYRDRSAAAEQRQAQAEQRLLAYLEKERGWDRERDIGIEELLANPRLYQLVRDTWIGERVGTLCSLKEDILRRQADADTCLARLIGGLS